MGEVYRAIDLPLRRNVALKVLPSSVAENQGRLRRFQQEAHTASMLNHPNILGTHELGSEFGAPYVVSKFLEGETTGRIV
jgi:serine/threonine protein kinase